MKSWSTREIFIRSVLGRHVSACDVLYQLNFYLPCGISQMKALLYFSVILLRLPLLVISAWCPLSVATMSRHFEIFSCFPLSQVQTVSFLHKPMCHALVFQEERFWISSLIKWHSPSVSIETRSPPWSLQACLFFFQLSPHFEKMYQELLKHVSWHSTTNK